MSPTAQIAEVLNLMEEYTQDVENFYSKPWLKTALVSNIRHYLNLPEEFVRRVVELAFIADSL